MVKIAPYMGWLYISAPYNKEFVEEIKSKIPSYKRKWNPWCKLWSVSPTERMALFALVYKYYGELPTTVSPQDLGLGLGSDDDGSNNRDSNGNGYSRVLRPTLASHYAALYLTENAPPDLLSLVYKFLAKKHHPDMGGDTETMQKINAAYTEIKRLKGG